MVGPLITIRWDVEGSYCDCIAGTSVCSHKTGGVLFIGLLATLVAQGIEKQLILDMLPVDIQEIQSRPTALHSYFYDGWNVGGEISQNGDNSSDEASSDDSEHGDGTSTTEEDFDENLAREQLWFTGNILDKIVRTITTNMSFSGFPSGFIRSGGVEEPKVNILTLEEHADVQQMQHHVLKLLVATGAAKRGSSSINSSSNTADSSSATNLPVANSIH